MRPACVNDYRSLARKRLPHFLFEYLDGAAYSELTAARNLADLESVALRQRVLRDVSEIDLSIELFGRRQDLPVFLAPIGLAGMFARRGEIQAARAAAARNIPYCLSTVSVCSLAEVAAGSDRPFWFQLYLVRDRDFVRRLLSEAEALGCEGLMLTVDMPVPGSRYRDYRSGLAGAPGLQGQLRRLCQAAMRPAWSYDVGLGGRPHSLGNVAPVLGGKSGLEDFFAWIRGSFDASATWTDLQWIRSIWKGPLVVKGVLDVDDAKAAASAGADGIVVSNHGGRQLDGVLSSTRALPRIADAVSDRLTVLVDGGVRSGLDVARMLALGAKGVLLGRAWAYALAGAGEAGVLHILDLIAAELRVTAALTGVTNIDQLQTSVIEGNFPTS